MTVIPDGRGQRRVATVGSETILLVEDENDLRSLLRHVLEGRGYKVLEACNGEDAVNLAKRHRGDIQLLLTDMIMPRMNGRDAAHLIRTSRPAIKVIYMTGYADDKILRPGSLSKDEALLEKPVVPDELALRIREMIESPEQGSARA
jgi:CheY-like chemotaxis protein